MICDLLTEMPAAGAHDPGGRAFPLAPDVRGFAVFGGQDDCYRYMLERRWREGGLAALFVMMNPSRADPMVDDQTIKGVTRKVRSWERRGIPHAFGRLYIANTFAYRCKDQARLAEVADPIGPENDAWILKLAAESDIIVFGYGKPKIPALRDRGPAVGRMLVEHGFQEKMHAMEILPDGTPRHPLYIKDAKQPEIWLPPGLKRAA